MNVNLQFVPRVDSGGTGAVALTEDFTGTPSPYLGQFTQFSKLGEPLLLPDVAKRKIAPFYRKRWEHLGTADEVERHVQDAVDDFVSSGLKKMLGPSEDIRRGEDKPWLFVARPGSPAILPYKQVVTPGHRSAAYRVREPVGQAQFFDPNTPRALQRANYSTEEQEIRASYFGILWGVNTPETWEANILNENVLEERRRAADLALDDFQENIASWGDFDRKLPGLFTLGDAVKVLHGQQFSSGAVDPEDMLIRMALLEQLYKRFNGGRVPTGAVIPESDRVTMTTTYFGAGQEGPSVWERATGYGSRAPLFPWLRGAHFTERLNTGNEAGNASRWVLFSGTQDGRLFLELTPTTIYGPFPDFFDQVYLAMRRTAGVVAKMPENVFYADFTP